MIKVKISAIEYRNNWGRREEAGFSLIILRGELQQSEDWKHSSVIGDKRSFILVN